MYTQETIIFIIIIILIILVIKYYPKINKIENFNYIGMHNYHKDSYKLGLHGKKKSKSFTEGELIKSKAFEYSNLKLTDFLQLVHFFVL